MESRTSAAITTKVVQKLPPAVIITPTNEDLFGSGGKKKAGLARTRKALADKTNESETSSELMTPMTLVKEEGGGEQMSCCYYRSTPYPKLHDDLHKQEAAALPEEQVLYTQVCTLLHNKVETEEYRLHRMPSEFRTPGELAAPTPANTPINVVPSTFSHSVLVMDKADVLPLELQLLYKFGKAATLSPSTEEEEDTSCMTKPLEDALDDPNHLEEHLEKVMWKSEKKNLSLSRETDVITVTTKPSGWVGRGEEVRKCMTRDDHEDDDDDASSECSVVVNVSSPHMQEKCESPSKSSIADNRINSSSPLQQYKDNSSENVKSDEQEKGYVDYEYYYYYYGEEEEDDEANEEYEDVELDGECNELCNAINKFTMNEKEESVGLPVSTGQHVRFSYNSDDEMEAEVVDAESCCKCPDSATVLRLKGLPTPKGKHLRFTEDIGTSV